jgi:hypothetical protein
MVCNQGVSTGGLNYLYCAAWFWMRSKEDSVKMDVLQWGYPKKRKIPKHCLRMSSGGFWYDTAVA